MSAEIVKSLNTFGEQLAELKKSHSTEIAALKNEIDTMQKRAARPLGPSTDDVNAAEHKVAFMRWAKTGDVTLLQKTMSIGSDPDGGFAVPDELDRAIQKVALRNSPVRALAMGVRADSGAYEKILSTTAQGAEWVSESGTRSDQATPQLASVKPAGGGLSAIAPVTNWLLNDAAFNMEQFIAEEIGRSFGVSEGAAFISGDGVNKPKGLLSYTLAATGDASRAFGTIEKLHSGTSADFDADDLIALFFKLKAQYRANSTWLMAGTTLEKIRKLKASGSGDYLFRLDAGGNPTLLGRPVVEDDNVPAPGASSNSIILADWKAAYTVVDVGSPIVLRDNLTTKGLTKFYVERRVLGAALDTNAAKVLTLAV